MNFISIQLLKIFFFCSTGSGFWYFPSAKMTMPGSVSSIIQRGGDSERPDPFWSPYLLSFPISTAAWASLLASRYSENTEDPRLTRGRTHKARVQLPPSPHRSQTHSLKSLSAQGLASFQDQPRSKTCFSHAFPNPKPLQIVSRVEECFLSAAAFPMNQWINMHKQSVGQKLRENRPIIMNRY